MSEGKLIYWVRLHVPLHTRRSFQRQSSSQYLGLVQGMGQRQLKSAYVGFCVSNLLDSNVDLPCNHSSFHSMATHRCLCILNTKSDDISRSHSAFNIIHTSRNSHSMCICLFLHGKWRTVMNDEWKLYAMNGKSEYDVNETVNTYDSDLPKTVGFRQHSNLDSNSDTYLLGTEETRCDRTNSDDIKGMWSKPRHKIRRGHTSC